MIQTSHDEASAVTAHPVLFESIAALAQRASIETSAKKLVEIDAYPSMVPAGTDVYVAWIPGFPYYHIVGVTKRLRQAGLNPVPHIAARQFASESVAMDFLGRLRDEAAVTRAGRSRTARSATKDEDRSYVGPFARQHCGDTARDRGISKAGRLHCPCIRNKVALAGVHAGGVHSLIERAGSIRQGMRT